MVMAFQKESSSATSIRDSTTSRVRRRVPSCPKASSRDATGLPKASGEARADGSPLCRTQRLLEQYQEASNQVTSRIDYTQRQFNKHGSMLHDDVNNEDVENEQL